MIITAVALGLAIGGAGAASAQSLTQEQRIQALIAQEEALKQERAGDRTRGLSGEAVSGATVGGAGGRVASVTERPERAGPAPQVASTGGQAREIRQWGTPVDFNITFESGSAFIRPGAEPTLSQLCELLNARDSFKAAHFMIIGHADRSGGAEYNRVLSSQRAETVKRWLTRDCGIDAARLEAVGVGFDYLLPGEPPVSEAQRRVEVQMTRPGDA